MYKPHKNKETRLCQNGEKCFKIECEFIHPSGIKRTGLTCKSDDACFNSKCAYNHTSGIKRKGLAPQPTVASAPGVAQLIHGVSLANLILRFDLNNCDVVEQSVQPLVKYDREEYLQWQKSHLLCEIHTQLAADTAVLLNEGDVITAQITQIEQKESVVSLTLPHPTHALLTTAISALLSQHGLDQNVKGLEKRGSLLQQYRHLCSIFKVPPIPIEPFVPGVVFPVYSFWVLVASSTNTPSTSTSSSVSAATLSSSSASSSASSKPLPSSSSSVKPSSPSLSSVTSAASSIAIVEKKNSELPFHCLCQITNTSPHIEIGSDLTKTIPIKVQLNAIPAFLRSGMSVTLVEIKNLACFTRIWDALDNFSQVPAVVHRGVFSTIQRPASSSSLAKLSLLTAASLPLDFATPHFLPPASMLSCLSKLCNPSQLAAVHLCLAHSWAQIVGPPGTGKTYTGALILNAVDMAVRATRGWAGQLHACTSDIIAKASKVKLEGKKSVSSTSSSDVRTSVITERKRGKGARKKQQKQQQQQQQEEEGEEEEKPAQVSDAGPNGTNAQVEDAPPDILNDEFLAQLPHIACLGPSNEAVDTILRRVMQNEYFGAASLFSSFSASSSASSSVTLHASSSSISASSNTQSASALSTSGVTDSYRPFIIRVGNETNMARDVFADQAVNALALVQGIVNLRWNLSDKEHSNWRAQVEQARSECVAKFQEIHQQRISWVSTCANVTMNCVPPPLSALSMQRALQARYAALKEVSIETHRYSNQASRALLPIFVDRAELVFATCNALGGVQGYTKGSRRVYDCVMVDESCQLRECEALLGVLKADRVIMIGDPAQLGPTVMYHGKHRTPLVSTLFARLQHCVPTCCLTTQYRMHPEISLFSSRFFYQSSIINGATKFISTAPLPPYHLRDIRTGQEERVGTSFCNAEEVRAVVSLVSELGAFKGSIGIITPYLAQKSMLMEALAVASQTMDIAVDTVDAFQGGEKDVILISCVRTGSGSRSSVGFLDDPNRINVAITRARACCCIMLRVEALETQAVWKDLIKNARERNLIK